MSPQRKDPIPNKDSKSPEMSPSKNDLILNQDSYRIIIQQDLIILPL